MTVYRELERGEFQTLRVGEPVRAWRGWNDVLPAEGPIESFSGGYENKQWVQWGLTVDGQYFDMTWVKVPQERTLNPLIPENIPGPRKNTGVHAVVWHSYGGKSRGKVWYTWHYAVYSGDKVVLYDNTGDYQKILRTALIEVAALRHMIIAGHKLKAYKGYW